MVESGWAVKLVSVIVATIIASLLVVSSVRAAAAPGGSPAPSVQVSVQKKNCEVPGLGIVGDGEEVLQEDDPGLNVVTCTNGRVCVSAILTKADFKHPTFRVCWYAATSKRATV